MAYKLLLLLSAISSIVTNDGGLKRDPHPKITKKSKSVRSRQLQTFKGKCTQYAKIKLKFALLMPKAFCFHQ